MIFGYNGEIRQITLPDPSDTSGYPRILVNGEGIHGGMGFTALFPDGWHDVTLEVGGQPGPGCWYISTPGFRDICPIGLFVKWE